VNAAGLLVDEGLLSVTLPRLAIAPMEAGPALVASWVDRKVPRGRGADGDGCAVAGRDLEPVEPLGRVDDPSVEWCCAIEIKFNIVQNIQLRRDRLVGSRSRKNQIPFRSHLDLQLCISCSRWRQSTVRERFLFCDTL